MVELVKAAPALKPYRQEKQPDDTAGHRTVKASLSTANLTTAANLTIKERYLTAGAEIVLPFSNPGSYLIKAISADGKILGEVTARVISATPDQTPCEFNFYALFPPATTQAHVLGLRGETTFTATPDKPGDSACPSVLKIKNLFLR